MEQTESNENGSTQNEEAGASPTVATTSDPARAVDLKPQANGGGGTEGPALALGPSGEAIPTPAPMEVAPTSPGYVDAIGLIEPRFPTLSVEKEFAQATKGTGNTAGLSDRQALQKVLSDRQNRYLARQLCWVLTIEGLDTYILMPRDPMDLDLLIEALRPTPRLTDVDIVIGVRGPIAPPEMCNGLMVPIVVFDQIYSFDVDSLIKSIPRPEKIAVKDFQAVAEELFHRIMQMADNAGATDEHRALNYLVVRYDAVYATAAEAFGRDSSLTAVEVRPSPLSGVRRIVDVIFSYTNRQTDVTEKFFCCVDVTEEFLHLVKPMSQYYDR